MAPKPSNVSSSFSQKPPIDWRSFWADFMLAGLVSGPIAAPFLAAVSLPILPQISTIIYFMGNHVCPQPDMGLELWPPNIMAVCMRCYGTLMGLIVMRYFAAIDQGQGRYWLPQYGWIGLITAILLCLVYPFELYAQLWGWWEYQNSVVTLFGLVSGLGLGAYIMPLLHRHPRQNQLFSKATPMSGDGE